MRNIVAILAGVAIYIYSQLGLAYHIDGYGLTPYIAVPVIILFVVLTTIAFIAESRRELFRLYH